MRDRMKKIILVLLLSLVLVACGNASDGLKFDEKNAIEMSEVLDYINTSNYKEAAGKSVMFSGIPMGREIFSDNTHSYYGVMLDIETYSDQLFIKVDKETKIKDGDVVVKGVFLAESDIAKLSNGMVQQEGILVVEAVELEVTDYMNAFAPTLKEIEINETQEQLGYKVTFEKIEFAEKETRLYVSVENDTDKTLSVYNYDYTMVAGRRNYDGEYGRYPADYPEIPTELHAGTDGEGIVVFEAVDLEKLENISIVMEGPFENSFELEFKDFVFEFSGK